jgi:hypothetical protein
MRFIATCVDRLDDPCEPRDILFRAMRVHGNGARRGFRNPQCLSGRPLNLNPFAFFRRPPPSGDPGLAALAGEITDNLRALGLHVTARAWGARFHEIRASSSPRMVVEPDNPAASGVALLLAGDYAPPTLVFERINSIERGLGRRMVHAALDALRRHPGLLASVRVNDLSPFQSDGRRWWEHIAAANDDFDWRITHDPDGTHRS